MYYVMRNFVTCDCVVVDDPRDARGFKIETETNDLEYALQQCAIYARLANLDALSIIEKKIEENAWD